MSWAKIDDRANEHRKMLTAGAEACWLWTCGLMYANRQPARDGFIPDAMLAMLYPFKAPKRLAAKLVEVGLWEKSSGGYQIHEFTTWNQTREQVEEEKAKARERAAKSYERRKAQKAESAGDSAPPSAPAEEPKNEAQRDPKNHDSSGSATSAPSATATATAPEVAAPSLAERAAKILANPYDGAFQRPSVWPEVIAAGEALGFGMAIKFGDNPQRDADLRAVLELFAAGYTPEEVATMGSRARDDEYFRKQSRPGPASFTAAVARRMMTSGSSATSKSAGYDADGWVT